MVKAKCSIFPMVALSFIVIFDLITESWDLMSWISLILAIGNWIIFIGDNMIIDDESTSTPI